MRGTFCALLVAIAGISVAASGASAATSVAGQARYAIDSAARTADYTGTAARNRFVILHEWERDRMLALKAADPRVTVLMYKNLGFMMERDQWGNASTGVSMQEAEQRPEWYLLDTDGRRFTSWSYDYIYAADVGSASYQRRWADNVIAKLQAQGWDGVFMDDTNPTMRHHYTVGDVAKYPSDALYGAATGAAVAYIGDRVRGAGKLIVPNFGSWRDYRGVVDGWLDHVSGGMEEFFTKWGNTADVGYLTGGDWDRNLGALEAAEAKRKYFLGVSHAPSGDAAAARYGWATTLLGAGGRAAFALHADYTNESRFPEYDYDIGEPTSARTRDAGGIHRRAFSNGLVLVNPTTTARTAALGGTYSGSGLTGVTSVTMAPHSGLILT
ncbi:MAG: putative glycoside hydrolase, partial [Solirubrobacteraceae bacterium]